MEKHHQISAQQAIFFPDTEQLIDVFVCVKVRTTLETETCLYALIPLGVLSINQNHSSIYDVWKGYFNVKNLNRSRDTKSSERTEQKMTRRS